MVTQRPWVHALLEKLPKATDCSLSVNGPFRTTKTIAETSCTGHIAAITSFVRMKNNNRSTVLFPTHLHFPADCGPVGMFLWVHNMQKYFILSLCALALLLMPHYATRSRPSEALAMSNVENPRSSRQISFRRKPQPWLNTTTEWSAACTSIQKRHTHHTTTEMKTVLNFSVHSWLRRPRCQTWNGTLRVTSIDIAVIPITAWSIYYAMELMSFL